MSILEGKTATVQSGWVDVLEFPDGTLIRLPVIVAKGVTNGPKLVLTAALHGWEIVGIEVIRRVIREMLDPKEMHGTVVAVPVANPLAFQVRAYITPQDNVDVGSAMPGDPAGTQSRRIANRLWEIIQESNCYIDLHCMEGPSVPWTIVRGPEAGIVVDRTLEVANAFGLPVTRPSPETRKRRPNTTADWAMSHGIPSIIPELPFPSIFMDERSVEVGVRGVLNVMKLLGMIPGEPEKQDLPIDVRGPIHTVMLAANRGGIVFPLCKLGARVNEGDPLVKIMNVFGDEVELVRAPKNGYLMSFPLNINQIAGTGDFVALLGYTA